MSRQAEGAGMTGITSLQEKEEQKARFAKSGLPVFWLNGVGYFVAALAFPAASITSAKRFVFVFSNFTKMLSRGGVELLR